MERDVNSFTDEELASIKATGCTDAFMAMAERQRRERMANEKLDAIDQKLRTLRDSMRRNIANPMRAWSTGEVVAVSTVEWWEEDITEILAALAAALGEKR